MVEDCIITMEARSVMCRVSSSLTERPTAAIVHVVRCRTVLKRSVDIGKEKAKSNDGPTPHPSLFVVVLSGAWLKLRLRIDHDCGP